MKNNSHEIQDLSVYTKLLSHYAVVTRGMDSPDTKYP